MPNLSSYAIAATPVIIFAIITIVIFINRKKTKKTSSFNENTCRNLDKNSPDDVNIVKNMFGLEQNFNHMPGSNLYCANKYSSGSMTGACISAKELKGMIADRAKRILDTFVVSCRTDSKRGLFGCAISETPKNKSEDLCNNLHLL